MKKIWAKAYEKEQEKRIVSLLQHTLDVMNAFNVLKNKNEKIKGIFRKDGRLEKSIKVSIFLHDIGKVLPSFQLIAMGNKEYELQDVLYEIPHSLFSLFWINKDKLKMEFGEEYSNYIISAVAYHHWRESFDNYISCSNENLIKLCQKIMAEWRNYLFDNVKEEFKTSSELNSYIQNYIMLNTKWLEGIINGIRFMDFAIPPYKFDYFPLRGELKKEWIFIAGFLQRCDHFASWCEEENEDINKIEIEQIKPEEVKAKISEKIGEKEDAWQINEVEGINKANKNLMLIAPTGSGKTEFAFLWANGEKLFYTLPMRAAVNQIYERAKEIFGEDRTGLLHSDADLYLTENESAGTEAIKTYELAKQLSYPVIISTGDQFFVYALRPPRYEKIFATLSYSSLVIDEIQAYDPKACAIIVKFIEWIYKMGGRFLVMTATLPKFIRDEILSISGLNKENLTEINLYKNWKENCENFYKHKIEIAVLDEEQELLTGEVSKIIQEAKEGKRVLVILNTVKFAQRVYKEIKEKAKEEAFEGAVYLLHSRFTIDDRKKKEDELLKEFQNPRFFSQSDKNEGVGKILVATQVVEASLDIDADVLFTEVCPLDTLVQRMGRVSRRYFCSSGKVINKSNGKIYELSKPFKVYEIGSPDKPNVYVWAFKDHLESGNGKVYPKELIKLSLAWLWKKTKKNDLSDLWQRLESLDSNGKDHDDIIEEKIFKEEFAELLKDNKGKKNESSSIYNKLIKANTWIKQLNKSQIELSEYDKYILVYLFYSALRKDGEYLSKFFETLDILDAGWMSDRKSDAENLFRDISNIQVVPENKLKEFEQEVNKFFSNKKDLSFALFKKDVLSKFVVTKPYEGEKDRVYEKLGKGLEKDTRKILKKWISEIFSSSKKYDNEFGLIVEEND
ncbi:CRISPR-associated helicase/endonuclease Cas3 [Anaerocellum danielii]|uniref:CRISPR-associated helicase/endonuclease Cas3 n=1 Tax=Anaerocellum danielii TaxID=1387557 RepID=A0ABZ0TZP8_9FIRM|nr:CRISPR-associated helicase/endonuclease Cas3 [Caldicellulosiruptor danielii]WPX08951.1 CRISPR-associated helicase/endonuclease Cas3 [Caldicellulosiruptor danielii]